MIHYNVVVIRNGLISALPHQSERASVIGRAGDGARRAGRLISRLLQSGWVALLTADLSTRPPQSFCIPFLTACIIIPPSTASTDTYTPVQLKTQATHTPLTL